MPALNCSVDPRKGAAVCFRGEPNGTVVDRLDVGDHLECAATGRFLVVPQPEEAEHHVVGCDRIPVREARLAERECPGQLVL
jgi:hypothetical protein